jgi:hypothetical protein
MNRLIAAAGALVIQASAEPFRLDLPAGPSFSEAEKVEQFARGSNVLVRESVEAESP